MNTTSEAAPISKQPGTDAVMHAFFRSGLTVIAILGSGAAAAGPVNLLADGDFEAYTGLVSYQTGPGGEKWGRAWTGGWDPAGLASSWQNNMPGGAWSGGQVNRTEDFGAGWKWAHSGVIFGIIKDRQIMSQSFTFTGSEVSTGVLSWYDANRPSWREHSYFGMPNPYRVTITDDLGIEQVIGDYVSEVASGLDAATVLGNTLSNTPDDRWSTANKKLWFERTSLSDFTLTPGRTYTLSFLSLSPPCPGGQNCDPAVASYNGYQDRTTFLDDVFLSARPRGAGIPEPGEWMLLGIAALCGVCLRRRPSGAATT